METIKILIVDDSATKRVLYKEILEKEGYIVVEAKDGKEGIDKARAGNPDVIIADLAMPRMNGFEMVKALKEDEKAKFIPVICVSTTYKDIESKLKALTEAGADEFFYMPENISELLLKVQVMLRIRKVYLELLEKNKQLQIFNKSAMDRELKMVELKNRIRELEEEVSKHK